MDTQYQDDIDDVYDSISEAGFPVVVLFQTSETYDSELEQYISSIKTELTEDMTDSSLSLKTKETLPSYGVVQIEDELMLYNSEGIIKRGFNQTTKQEHNLGDNPIFVYLKYECYSSYVVNTSAQEMYLFDLLSDGESRIMLPAKDIPTLNMQCLFLIESEIYKIKDSISITQPDNTPILYELTISK